MSAFFAGEKIPFSVIMSLNPITVAPFVFIVKPAGIPPSYKKSVSDAFAVSKKFKVKNIENDRIIASKYFNFFRISSPGA